MIDWKRTKKETGKSKEYFDKFPNSTKKIWCSCDNCKKMRLIQYRAYRNLCKSCSKSNENHPMFGKHLSNEHKEKLSAVGKGRKHSDETKKKMSDAQKGELSNNYGKRGKDTYHFGYKHSNETKEKIRNINIGKKVSNETKKKMSENRMGKDNPNWKGGFDTTRPWVLPESQCIKLNKRFIESEMHHITKSIVIYIPENLHHHISHNLKTGKNMGKMNMLALQYIRGWL